MGLRFRDIVQRGWLHNSDHGSRSIGEAVSTEYV
jgi:hypothetical protein